ncbi:hypothetical protein [Actinoplanes sp. NPDC049802]|uniref:hypothetical protein n=1 Tax=Actinoplanes sp. NPDC049802 TaxID=3154742 RepID=UPI0033C737D2
MTVVRISDHAVAARPGIVVLPEVLVPMLWWRGVPMHRTLPMSMTPMEQFVLDLALTTGRADGEEFVAITGLPRELLPAAARRLVSSRILHRADGGFVPRFLAAEKAAQTRVLYERRPVDTDIVFLPRTGDLIALDPRSSGLRELDRLRPRSAGNAPLPADLAGAGFAEYLQARLQAGSIAGLSDDVTDVAWLPGESPRLPEDGRCPAYRCRGELRRDASGRYIPSITYGGAGQQPATVALPGAKGLAERWLTVANLLDAPDARTHLWNTVMGCDGYPVPAADRTAPGRWICSVPAEAAQRLADQGRNLALPLGVTITDEDAMVEATLELAAADDAARRLIAFDRLLTAAAQPRAHPVDVPRTPAAWQRAWRLGYPGLVYALREAEDFRHG